MWMHQWLPRCGPSYSSFGHLPDHYMHMATGGNSALHDEGVRLLTQLYTNGDESQGLAALDQVERIVMLAQDENKRKIILEVLKARLDLGWPYNYKSLDIMAYLPPDYLVPMLDKLSEFAAPPQSVVGATQLKEVAGRFIEKVKAEKAKKEAEDFDKQQKEIAAMWSGLWANRPSAPVYPGHVFFPNTAQQPVPYPYVPPGLSCPPVTWASKAPEGWSSPNVQPPPSHSPFSRVTFHALQPEPPKDANDVPLQPIVYMPPRMKK